MTMLPNKLQEINLNVSPKLIISEKLQHQVGLLHHKLKDVEWSGILVYTILEGKIEEPETLVIKAEGIHLLDVGSHSYTEYSPDESVVELMDDYPTFIDGGGLGHIHTHHSMPTFFSGTDMGELHDNAGEYNYYVSLIANFKSEYKAKIAIETEIAQTVNIKDSEGKDKELPLGEAKKVLLLMDCNIEVESSDEVLIHLARVREKKAAEAKLKAAQKPVQVYNKYYNSPLQGKQTSVWAESSRTLHKKVGTPKGYNSYSAYKKAQTPLLHVETKRIALERSCSKVETIPLNLLLQFTCEWISPTPEFTVVRKDGFLSLLKFINRYFADIEMEEETAEEVAYVQKLETSFVPLMKKYKIDTTPNVIVDMMWEVTELVNKETLTPMYLVDVLNDAFWTIEEKYGKSTSTL